MLLAIADGMVSVNVRSFNSYLDVSGSKNGVRFLSSLWQQSLQRGFCCHVCIVTKSWRHSDPAYKPQLHKITVDAA